jgi:sugar lactone lactonase YvrE
VTQSKRRTDNPQPHDRVARANATNAAIFFPRSARFFPPFQRGNQGGFCANIHGAIALGTALAAVFFITGCKKQMGGTIAPTRMFGQTGLGPGDFSYPRTIAIDAHDRVFVIDKSARVQRFNDDGEFELGWQMPQWSAGKPTGVSIAPNGDVYIADTHYYRVAIYDPDGNWIDSFGTEGHGAGQFTFPTDVAFDADGFIYVSEYGGNDRISKFTPDHKYLMSIGGPDADEASLSRPLAIAFDRNQDLWVADACHHRICRFSRDGKLLQQFGHAGNAPGELYYPYGLCIEKSGTLLVAEYGNNRIQRFTTDGQSLGTLGTAGREPGQFAYPWSLALDSQGRIFVVDSGNNRIQVFDDF